MTSCFGRISPRCGESFTEQDARLAQSSVGKTSGLEVGYIIMDVRTQREYEDGHIPKAVCNPNESNY